ncbi:MAG: hypothetical protein ACRECW_16115 [Phyllobacterium sp.]
MTLSKSWYLSKTIWAALVTIVLSVASLFGISTEMVDPQSLIDTILQFVTALSGLFALLGRLKASTTIKGAGS